MIIKKIRNEVNKSDNKYLDKKAYCNDQLSDIFYVFTVSGEIEKDNSIKKVEDVPVKNIFSLSRNDGWEKPNPTWKELLNNWIEGTYWKDEAIEYFENDIRDKPFPADDAKRPLSLGNYEGVYICTNGNHRLVGAYCWSLAKFGEMANLKKVNVSYYSIRSTMKNFIKNIKDTDKIEIFVEKNYHEKNTIYIYVTNKKENYIKSYSLDKTLTKTEEKKYQSILNRWFFKNFRNESDINDYNKYKKSKCIEVDNEIINIWKKSLI